MLFFVAVFSFQVWLAMLKITARALKCVMLYSNSMLSQAKPQVLFSHNRAIYLFIGAGEAPRALLSSGVLKIEPL
jgi:hypothetical protein